MTKVSRPSIFSSGLAIFSMLFGAGNLMYPIKVGMDSGDKLLWGLLGFILAAVVLPIIGFVSMILFNGNYRSFFNRLGKPAGSVLTFFCMLIIGPIIAIPRITTLSHTMIAPFLPGTLLGTINPTSSLLFALLFLTTTFLVTYRENRIMSILGNVISPLLLVSLAIIITKGLLFHGTAMHNNASPFNVFITSLTLGYETLDLIGALFFSSIVLSILKSNMEKVIQNNPKLLAFIGLQASMVGVGFLSVVYIGMSILGMYHGQGLEAVNTGELFRAVAFRVVGVEGAAVIATAVLMACLSTAIALSAVVAEYLQGEVFRNHINYTAALILVLIASLPLSVAGLTTVLKLTGGFITYVGYPVLITLTIANILYQLIGFKSVKLPVAITFIIFAALNFNMHEYLAHVFSTFFSL